MKINPRFLALLSLVLIAVRVPAADVAPAKAAKTVRLLTVGNSFSQNATRFLPDLAAAGGHTLIHRPIVVGGASLQLHAEKALKHDEDAKDSAGLYSNGRSLKQELAADRWDFVTIQQASLKSHDVNTYRPYARQLSDYIRKHAPGAALLVHETWAYRRDDPRFTKSPATGEPATQEAMYQGLAGAYRTIAAELGARLIPVGDAFHRADTDPEWGYRPDTKFDFQSAQPSALPDQTHSLHTGWRWAKQKDGKIALGMDGHHANAAGEYLGACVFYEVLFGESVVGNAFVPPGVDPAWARFLQETAHQAVEREARRSTKKSHQEKYLLLDSRIIEQTDNARLAIGTVKKHPANPLFREDKPWEVRFDNLYANVIYDEDERVYKCWYSPFIVDEAVSQTPREQRGAVPYRPRGREMGVCYATSQDGLAWVKPELGLIEFQGSRANNLVVRGPHGAGVFKDLREADPQRRYKMFYQGMNVRFSADGLHWSDACPCPEIAARGDTHNNACWCAESAKYAGITRLWDGQRIVGRTESPDFLHWTKAVEAMRGDPDNQTYAMPVLRYADVYLGLVMIFCPKPNRVHCELAWSPDTVSWNRIDQGTPLILLSEKPGDYDWGCAYAAAYPVVLDDEIRLYYGASNGTHNGWRDGFLALALLRTDGWAGYTPEDEARPAVVATRAVPCTGQALRVTADIRSGGSVKVTVLDAEGRQAIGGRTLTASATDAVVADVAQKHGQQVRVRFDLEKATVYAFAFGPERAG